MKKHDLVEKLPFVKENVDIIYNNLNAKAKKSLTRKTLTHIQATMMNSFFEDLVDYMHQRYELTERKPKPKIKK